VFDPVGIFTHADFAIALSFWSLAKKRGPNESVIEKYPGALGCRQKNGDPHAVVMIGSQAADPTGQNTCP
jgi:hypothetical protein